MTPTKKRILRFTNKIEAFLKKRLQPQDAKTGLLHHVEDPRDYEATLGWLADQPEYSNTSTFNGQIMRQLNNYCVFASRNMGRWYQQGIRFSLKYDIVHAYRSRRTSGDGFSSLSAGNKGGREGLVLYEDMPEEHVRWRDVVKTSDREYQKAKNNICTAIPSYRRIYSLDAAVEALKKGFVLYTGYKWYSSDYRVEPPLFLYEFKGKLIGYHAINISGMTDKGLFQNPNTFGKEWGDNGIGWLESIFNNNLYPIYIEEFIPLEKRVELFKRQNEGRLVRSAEDAKCYILQQGRKHHVRGDDNMQTYFELEKTLGLTYVKKELLDAVEEAAPYPFIHKEDNK